WGRELLAQMQPFAEALDAAHGNTLYTEALAHAVVGLDQPETLPSARVLQAMQQDHQGSFAKFVLAESNRTRDVMLAQPLDAGVQAQFEQESAQSWEAQRAIEAADSMPFGVYLKEFLAPHRLVAGRRTVAA
ncbi:MAG: glutamate--cysteine ligase, partial [Curvibacter sp.]